MKLSYSRFASIVRFPYLLGLLVALVLADGVITEFLIAGRLGQEGNLFLHGILGSGNLIVFKIIGAFVSALILWDIHRRHPNLAYGATLLFTALYTGVVCWNVSVFVASL